MRLLTARSTVQPRLGEFLFPFFIAAIEEMEEEDCPKDRAFSPTLESFKSYMAVYSKYIPEKIRVEKRLAEIKEYGKTKRVKKEMPRYPEKASAVVFRFTNRRTGIS